MRQESEGLLIKPLKLLSVSKARSLILVIALLCIWSLFSGSTRIVQAGKNQCGALVVHTDDAHGWTEGVCDNFDAWVPDACEYFGTRVDRDENTPALIWLIAVFSCNSSPGVTIIYFGHDHNLPEQYHEHWGPCGSAGTAEFPDAGWPDSPATAGNSVAFGTPIVGDLLFPFYHVEVWGFSDAYYCTDVNPIGGYAAFADDSSPPVIDEIGLFGCARWYRAGYNEPEICWPSWGACCHESGWCYVDRFEDCMNAGAYDWVPHAECDPDPCLPPGACCMTPITCIILCEEDCTAYGGEFVAEGVFCDPDPCGPTSSVPEISTETVTWGRVKSTYRK